MKRFTSGLKYRPVVSFLTALFVGSILASSALAWHKHDRPDRYDLLENYLRDDETGAKLLVLYRTYLPERGRRRVPLPTVQKVTADGMEAPMPECLLTRRIHLGRVDFSSLLQNLATGNGDQVDFLVELARILRVPVPRSEEAIAATYPHCAWWGFVDEKFLNWIFPDATATYWFQPLVAPVDTDAEFPQFFMRGDFINERYKSLAIYDISFNPYQYRIGRGPDQLLVDTTITDFQMKPSDGFNPFITPDIPRVLYGKFQVLFMNNPTRAANRMRETNILPLRDNTGGTGGLTRTGGSIPLPLPCGRMDSAFNCPLEGMPSIPSEKLASGVVSNPSNAYVFTITNQLTPRIFEPFQERPKALVIRGRLPRTIGTDNPPNDNACRMRGRSADVCYCQRNPASCKPIPWTGASNVYNPNVTPPFLGPRFRRESIDMRYWSMCTAVMARPYPTVGNILPQNRFRQNPGCVPDSDIIQTDADGNVDPNGGWFTVVITRANAKPTVFTEEFGGVRNTNAGANWIQGIAGIKLGINTRNMFPNDDFANAATGAQADSAWQTAFEAMQDFYPQMSTTCSVETINTQGWGQCWTPKVSANTCGGVPGCVPDPGGSNIGIPAGSTQGQ